jgi:hypothetical protein
MSDLSYPAFVRELSESEIFGEAGFRALVDVATASSPDIDDVVAGLQYPLSPPL